MKGQPLEIRPSVSKLGPRTMAIRMPQQGITEYVRDHLHWFPILDDEDLVASLEEALLK
jgi:hypothetical protein